MDPLKAANPSQQKPDDVKADVAFHVHPSAQVTDTTGAQSAPGTVVFGGTVNTTTYNFVQAPSAVDIGNAGEANLNIVVGARDKTVYVYDKEMRGQTGLTPIFIIRNGERPVCPRILSNSLNCWGETYSSTATAPGVLPSPSNAGIDAWGNLTNRSVVSDMAGNCTTEPLSVLATTQNQLNGNGMMYDPAGNVTNDGYGNTPTHDAENRIATDAGVTYYYDADGARMEKSSGTKYWFGPSGQVLTESSLSGTINEEYVFFNGVRIARVDRPTGAVHYYFSNQVGSHTMVTSATGVCEQDIDYFPYGGVIVDHCLNVPQHYKFTGKERDSESGLDNFGARYNASTMGRFMSPDPLGGHLVNPQSLNKYAYVLNNPLTLTDPTGLDSYLQCGQASSTCASQTVGYDKDGKAQTALVQGVTNSDKSFTATVIGNANPDGSGGLVDKTTGTGAYTASVNGSGVQFSNDGGKTSSTGVFDNGTPQTKFQDAGFANGGALSGFSFTLTNSKMEANQAEAGTFTFSGTEYQAGQALMNAGFVSMGWFGRNNGFDEFRSTGSGAFGENSAHFNVEQVERTPSSTVPTSGKGNMHFGEHFPLSLGVVDHILESNK
jgi:RHS repeat-associated protein